jgi:hypothetical protein
MMTAALEGHHEQHPRANSQLLGSRTAFRGSSGGVFVRRERAADNLSRRWGHRRQRRCHRERWQRPKCGRWRLRRRYQRAWNCWQRWRDGRNWEYRRNRHPPARHWPVSWECGLRRAAGGHLRPARGRAPVWHLPLGGVTLHVRQRLPGGRGDFDLRGAEGGVLLSARRQDLRSRVHGHVRLQSR